MNVIECVFLDECDPAYLTGNLDSVYVEYFTWGIVNITELRLPTGQENTQIH